MSCVKENVPNPKGVLVHCPNVDCNYTWRYAGRFILYATCPSCRRSVKISENRIESLQSVPVGRQGQIAVVRTTPAKELMHDDE
jgi:hypothetical protein